jgi:hypothetical protein
MINPTPTISIPDIGRDLHSIGWVECRNADPVLVPDQTAGKGRASAWECRASGVKGVPVRPQLGHSRSLYLRRRCWSGLFVSGASDMAMPASPTLE